jgi:hypothetical protein
VVGLGGKEAFLSLYSMSSDTKSVVISGAAAESYLTGTKTRRKRKQRGGQQVPSEAQEVPMVFESDRQLQVEKISPSKSKNVIAVVTREAEPEKVAEPQKEVPKQNITEVLDGGAKEKKKLPVKVILEKTKKAKEKVVLAPAKPKVVKETPGVLPLKKVKTKTMKIARRIKVSLDGLSKRIHRAKTIKKETEKTSVEDIKKKLHQAGLIKKDSKAPEAILRQMYTDFEQLKHRALKSLFQK